MAQGKIPLKTDGPSFDKYDFVQTESGSMEELTVTITLAEYRHLLQSRARLEGIYIENTQRGGPEVDAKANQ